MPEKTNKKKLGNRISFIRTSLGLTMEEFIERIDNKPGKGRSGTVNNWEAGINAPNKRRLKRIAELGNVSVDYLLHGTQNIDPIHLYDIIEKDNKREATTKEEKMLLNEASLEEKVHQNTLLGNREKEFIANVNYLINNNFDSEQQLYLSTILNFSFSYLFKQNNNHVDDFRKIFSGLQTLMDPKYSRSKDELRNNIKKYFNNLLNNLD